MAQSPASFGGQPNERSLSAFDRNHRAVFSFIYSLTFGKTQKSLVSRVVGGAGVRALIAASDAMYIQRPACIVATTCGKGNPGRNTMHSPGITNFNVKFQKDTTVSERVHMQVRAEFFNLFNHVQHGVASASALAPGLVTLGANLQSTFTNHFLNAVFQDGGGRVSRFQLQVVF